MLNIGPSALADGSQVEAVPRRNKFGLCLGERIAFRSVFNCRRTSIVLLLGAAHGIRKGQIEIFRRHRCPLSIRNPSTDQKTAFERLMRCDSEYDRVPPLRHVATKTQETGCAGQRMVIHDWYSARLDTLRSPKDLRTAT
jgi:hypothetical protein